MSEVTVQLLDEIVADRDEGYCSENSFMKNHVF